MKEWSSERATALLASLVGLVKHRPAAPARIFGTDGHGFFPQGVLAALGGATSPPGPQLANGAPAPIAAEERGRTRQNHS